MMHERGIFVVPDILANAGGVTTSYFEWVQNRHGYYWSLDEVNTRLEQKMVEAFAAVRATSQRYKVDMRTAAYVVRALPGWGNVDEGPRHVCVIMGSGLRPGQGPDRKPASPVSDALRAAF
jgi:hypothetical protein